MRSSYLHKLFFIKSSPSQYLRCCQSPSFRRHFSVLSRFTTVNPISISGATPGRLHNCLSGEWKTTAQTANVIDPLSGEAFIISPDTQPDELQPFIELIKKVPKTGTHNLFKSPEKFQLFGDANRKIAELLHDSDVLEFFIKCIQRVMPKSRSQAQGEVVAVRKFFENFSGDNVRMLMRGFIQAGDHTGQRTMGCRWPYGPVAIIAPFNFPLKIPILQFASAAMVGNVPVLKQESRTALPVEQFLRLMQYCGYPNDVIHLIHCSGSVMSKLLASTAFTMTQFTGSSATALSVIQSTKGKVKLEDSGFNWKVLGPLNNQGESSEKRRMIDYVAYQCDKDAYALSGQQCSAQSLAIVHEDWMNMGLLSRIAELAKLRSLSDLSLSPVLSHSNTDIKNHIDKLLSIPGSKLLFGGNPLTGHRIPSQYGAFEPTAVALDLDVLMSREEYFSTATTELFGPLQVVVVWSTAMENKVLEMLERIDVHLTAAVVSTSPEFVNRVLGRTTNGTTYVGIRARTTGAPQSHWFGPAGTPLAAGIGTPEAILSTWTCHREIIFDEGPIPENWQMS